MKSKRAGMLSVITNHLTFTDFANEVAFYRRFERGVWGGEGALVRRTQPTFAMSHQILQLQISGGPELQ